MLPVLLAMQVISQAIALERLSFKRAILSKPQMITVTQHEAGLFASPQALDANQVIQVIFRVAAAIWDTLHSCVTDAHVAIASHGQQLIWTHPWRVTVPDIKPISALACLVMLESRHQAPGQWLTWRLSL